MMRVSDILLLLICLLALGGCGIKGSLYMPDIPEPPASAPPTVSDDTNSDHPR